MNAVYDGGDVGCYFCRRHSSDARTPYYVRVWIGCEFFAQGWRGLPQADAVMDDFGNLIIVGGWI